MDITDPRYVAGLDKFSEGILGLVKADKLTDSDAARAIRAIYSQANDRYGKHFVDMPDHFFSDTDMFGEIFKKFSSDVTSVQQSQNYAKYIVQGHHGISVSSMEAASRHLPTAQRMQFLKEFNSMYGGGGTDESSIFALSNLGHQSKDRARGSKDVFNAHVDSNPATLVDSYAPNQGTWQGIDFTKYTDPKELATEFWNQSGHPQIRLAELAMEQPQEVAVRKALAERIGVSEREFFTHPQKVRKLLENSGLTKDESIKILQESYGMTYVPPDPNRVKVPFEKSPRHPKMTHPILVQLEESLKQSKATRAAATTAAATQYGIPPKALAALGFLPAVGALLDAGDSVAGTHQAVTGKTKGDKLAGTFQAIGGAAGLASLSPLAPVAAPVSMAANALAIATQRRADMDKPKPPKPLYGAPVTARIVPTTPPRSKPVGNGKGGLSKPVGGKPKPANKPKPTNKPLNLGNEARYWGRKLLGIKI